MPEVDMLRAQLRTALDERNFLSARVDELEQLGPDALTKLQKRDVTQCVLDCLFRAGGSSDRIIRELQMYLPVKVQLSPNCTGEFIVAAS